MKKADLHIHSKFSSDGEFEIQEIIEKCINNNVDTFSITDHNTIDGVEEAYSLSMQHGLDFVSGIEIDCNFEGTDLHLLGYNIDWKSNDFKIVEKSFSEKVMGSFDEMIYNIRKLGFNIDADAVINEAGKNLPTGELIAEVMLSDKKYETPNLKPYMAGGDRSDMPYINFYLDYFAQGRPAHVHIDFMTYTDALQMVLDNNGTPVIAHPGLNFKRKESIVEKLVNRGAKGVEVFNNYHTPAQIDYFANLAKQKGVLITCGSDFHGKNKPLINIGNYRFDERYITFLENSILELKRKKQ